MTNFDKKRCRNPLIFQIITVFSAVLIENKKSDKDGITSCTVYHVLFLHML